MSVQRTPVTIQQVEMLWQVNNYAATLFINGMPLTYLRKDFRCKSRWTSPNFRSYTFTTAQEGMRFIEKRLKLDVIVEGWAGI